jgi:surfactin synthase thioesterase subunit
LDCPVVAYVGREDPMVTPTQAAGWAGLTTGPFHLRAFPGGHFYLVEHERDLLADIAARLA